MGNKYLPNRANFSKGEQNIFAATAATSTSSAWPLSSAQKYLKRGVEGRGAGEENEDLNGRHGWTSMEGWSLRINIIVMKRFFQSFFSNEGL